jgi:hypothetical protein
MRGDENNFLFGLLSIDGGGVGKVLSLFVVPVDLKG